MDRLRRSRRRVHGNTETGRPGPGPRPAHRRELPRHRPRFPPPARRRQARPRQRPRPALHALRRGGAGPGDTATDDKALSGIIAANPAIYGHPTSTVPMGGPGDPRAVVDSVGAVKGVDGLRVVDTSIIPEVPSSTTNVTVIMVAERIHERVYATG
ncbi:GMC family oxidoreductase [Streptomyces hokutonensis]|uniref:GMC family oxidoreductase n=1 Tax=Streptomyces hokutonensis TaxID=1306990 RepID=UPI0036CD88A8